MKFICKNCGYRFEAEKADSCSYCGEKSVKKEESAEELIEKAEKFKTED